MDYPGSIITQSNAYRLSPQSFEFDRLLFVFDHWELTAVRFGDHWADGSPVCVRRGGWSPARGWGWVGTSSKSVPQTGVFPPEMLLPSPGKEDDSGKSRPTRKTVTPLAGVGNSFRFERSPTHHVEGCKGIILFFAVIRYVSGSKSQLSFSLDHLLPESANNDTCPRSGDGHRSALRPGADAAAPPRLYLLQFPRRSANPSPRWQDGLTVNKMNHSYIQLELIQPLSEFIILESLHHSEVNPQTEAYSGTPIPYLSTNFLGKKNKIRFCLYALNKSD